MRKSFLVLAIMGFFFAHSYAQVTLCPIFSDNMVMQRETDNAPIWGRGIAGKKITIITSWDNTSYSTMVDASGKWATNVKTPTAGGPYTITISDGSKKKIVLKNVLIGEVWICSGQSNMEMPVEGWGKVNNFSAEEIDANNYKNIRLLTVKHVTSPTPLDNVPVVGDSWLVCDAQNVADFSATAYFFGRELYDVYNIPIGLINTSWGGTIIEAWMSHEAFESIPGQKHNIEAIDSLPTSVEERKNMFNNQYAEWLKEIEQIIENNDVNTASYTSADYDDSSWNNYMMPSVDTAEGTTNAIWWARKVVDIPSSWAGKKLILNLGKIDDNDITYFNGTLVGNTVGYTVERTYDVPASIVTPSKVAIAIQIHDTGGPSGIDCETNDFNIQLAGSNEKIPLAGEWKYKTSIGSSELPSIPTDTSSDPNIHTFLYNAMLHPFVPFAIRGVIWYQGEANVMEAYQYRELMPIMINDWRTKWGYDFPFLIVQLANYKKRVYVPQESVWAELREAQYKTRCDMAGVGMATIIDIGEANDIHPKNKQEVGRRLALNARNIAYNENIPFEGPLYKEYKIEGDKIQIFFSPTTDKEITSLDGGPLTGFEISGPDHVWYKAEAIVVDGGVLVSSPDVPFPLAVRYAWADNPECNLTNGTRLPASPFRTDEWERVSYGNKR